MCRAYVRIPYPGGDVPADTGVCTDEIIRSYRASAVDLQKEVHEDMVQNFGAYPNKWRWRLAHPDSNIDHRRVPNLMVFFQRKGESLPMTARAEDYVPGDLVTWDLGGGVPHIGIVVDRKHRWSGRYRIVHNIGEGPKMEDVLFQLEDHGPLPIFRAAAIDPRGLKLFLSAASRLFQLLFRRHLRHPTASIELLRFSASGCSASSIRSSADASPARRFGRCAEHNARSAG